MCHVLILLPSTCPEPCGTPVYRLDAALGLDRSNSSSDIRRHSVFTKEQMGGNILAVLDRLIGKCNVHSFLTVGLLSWDRRAGQWEAGCRVGHQKGLELHDVHIEGTIKHRELEDMIWLMNLSVSQVLSVQAAVTDAINGLS